MLMKSKPKEPISVWVVENQTGKVCGYFHSEQEAKQYSDSGKAGYIPLTISIQPHEQAAKRFREGKET